MSDLLRVVSECTRRAGLLPLYEKQLAAAGIPLMLNVTGQNRQQNEMWSMEASLSLWRRVAEKHGDCKYLVLTDAWDVLFYGTCDEVVSKIPDKGILLAAERNCFPDAYLANEFPGETPWRYVNGGISAGRPEEYMRWCDAIERDPSYLSGMMNQQWLNHCRLRNSEITSKLDDKTELVYCMCLESGEMQPANGRPVNALTGTTPNFIHFNGKTDPTMFLWKMQLSQ